MPPARLHYPELTDTQRDLVTSHIDLAHNLTNTLTNTYKTSLEPEELQGIAYLALCIAASHYDPTRGTAFSTLAYTSVRRAIYTANRRGFSKLHKQADIDTSILEEIVEAPGLTMEEEIDMNDLHAQLTDEDMDLILANREEVSRYARANDLTRSEARYKQGALRLTVIRALTTQEYDGKDYYDRLADLTPQERQLYAQATQWGWRQLARMHRTTEYQIAKRLRDIILKLGKTPQPEDYPCF